MRMKKVFDLNFNCVSFFFPNLNISALPGLPVFITEIEIFVYYIPLYFKKLK